jgi:hypothetical protein
MANAAEQAADPLANRPEAELEHGAYEVIRNRLAAAGRELRSRLERLNAARKEVFGAIETRLLATERVTTAHNCLPRDLVPVGNRFLFGYNVHLGLKSTTSPEDVFAVYELHDHSFSEQPRALIADERFERDFAELYKYYKKTQFAKFWRNGPVLHMVFRIGEDLRDIKTFKWLIDGNELRYVDNRSEIELQYPPQHEFDWIRTHRAMHAAGVYPHINIVDRLFVETTGGDLTVKIENNTDTGEGIYAEPVDDVDQRLDDAEIFYALVGDLILLKIRPYQETKFRYLVYSEKSQAVRRIDTIEQACVLLPEDQGIVFANGYVLQTGEYRTFDLSATGMVFRERIASSNGEDFLFVFYHRLEGAFVLLPYNLIERQVDTPVLCNGYALFDNGEMLYFKSHGEPQKHHALQIWQTPFATLDYQPAEQRESYLFKVGNRDIVRGLAECRGVLGLIAREDGYQGVFVDLVKQTGDLLDSYYWLGHAEAGNLREVLLEIKQAAEAAVGEFEKVQLVRRNTREQVERASAAARKVMAAIGARRFEVIGDYVRSLADLRAVRGEIIALAELRYVDRAQVDAMEQEIAQQTERLSFGAVRFLLQPDALAPYEEAVQSQRGEIDKLEKGADARRLTEAVEANAADLAMLIEIVGNLKIDDATERMAIIDAISAVFARLNQVRAQLKNRSGELLRQEGAAEFGSQLKLLGQSVVNYLDVADTPEKCDEHLTRLMVQLEEVEGRFAEFDEFVVQLAEKRDEIYNAFESRKLQLMEARNQRATALMSAAERILKGVKARVDKMESVAEIEGYYAADMMIEKLREIITSLGGLGDSVKVDDLQSRMKTIREDAVRQLKDRQELYEDGANVIRLGRHRFSVNRQSLDLTTVERGGELFFHLSGTNYFDRITDAELLATRDVWRQEIVSENADVYRAEYLAHHILLRLGVDGEPTAADLRQWADERLLEYVQRSAAPRYSEGYVKGVHDQDAARMLRALVELEAGADLLRYHPKARALAMVFWHHWPDADRKRLTAAWLAGFGSIRALFPAVETSLRHRGELEGLLTAFVASSQAFAPDLVHQAAEYLFEQLVRGAPLVSSAARDICLALHAHLETQGAAERYRASTAALEEDSLSAFLMQRAWVDAYLADRGDVDTATYADEAAALLLTGTAEQAQVLDAPAVQTLTGMIGSHPRVAGGEYRLDYNAFLLDLARYRREVVPRFEAYHRLKQQLVEAERQRLRLDEFRPRVLTSFVRNKLIDQVYLPLIGDNLAKQIGVAGEQKRTDRMGMLLLISPPGYGKTTLMEYLANRLGLVFMKINGPAIGHRVTSLDPAEAPNAAAREELEKLTLALEMGDNVMLYLDDIQHCNAELLQKFISLCDAQRKIEGVHRGKTRTYDLRGKKVAVVMAGNPYTESGEQFKLPDMLANRADTYNLGEIIGGNAEVFELSYLENSLTSNPALNPLASRSPHDVYSIIEMAASGVSEGVELEGSYSLTEVNEMVEVMRKLMRVRDVVLRVNQEYIRSAATSDDYRTEPPFKLQGSYRNMNRIAERVVALMTPAEVDALIADSYQNDAQTLTTGAESNLLKFKELFGKQTPVESSRWDDIRRTYRRNVQLRGLGEDDKFSQVVVQLGSFADGLDAIRQTLSAGMARLESPSPANDGAPSLVRAALDEPTLAAVGKMLETLRPEPIAVPEIQVVSRVPTALLEVLRAQFQLMQTWLQPLQRQSTDQQQQFQQLKQAVDTSIAATQKLIGDLEEAARRGTSLEETLARHQVAVKHPPRK